MDFALSELQQTWHDAAARLASAELGDDVRGRDERGEYWREAFLPCARFGIQGLNRARRVRRERPGLPDVGRRDGGPRVRLPRHRPRARPARQRRRRDLLGHERHPAEHHRPAPPALRSGRDTGSPGGGLDPTCWSVYHGTGHGQARAPPVADFVLKDFGGIAMTREKIKATVWGVLATAALAGLIVLGSRNLAHFDAALVGYTFASLFAAFGIAYRYAMWLQRPPTALYWRRGWQLVPAAAASCGRNLVELGRRGSSATSSLNRFIWRREPARAGCRTCSSCGAACSPPRSPSRWSSAGSTSRPLPGDLDVVPRRSSSASRPFAFPIDSLVGFLIFHGLVWSSFLVIAGVMLAMRRRMRDHGAAALQQFGEDFLPLILLFADQRHRPDADGQLHLDEGLRLRLPGDPARGHGDLHAAVAAVRQVLPHLPAAGAARRRASTRTSAGEGEQARCRRCGEPFASRMHVEDLIAVERQLGYRYEMAGSATEHYQWICPRCRRTMLALAQGRLWRTAGATAARDADVAIADRSDRSENGLMATQPRDPLQLIEQFGPHLRLRERPAAGDAASSRTGSSRRTAASAASSAASSSRSRTTRSSASSRGRTSRSTRACSAPRASGATCRARTPTG